MILAIHYIYVNREHTQSKQSLTLKGHYKVNVNHHTKNQGHRSNGLAVRVLTHTHTHTHTERQKDGSDSMTSTAEAGGKNM